MEFKSLKTLVTNALATEGSEVGALADVTWVDIGTKINALSGDEFLDFTNKFALGVIRTYVNDKVYRGNTFGVMRDSLEYNGVIQRIACGFAEIDDNKTVGLVSGTDYRDTIYHGVTCDVKLQTKDEGISILWSIPHADVRQMFSSEEGATKYASLVYNSYMTTYNSYIEQLCKSLLCDVILNAYADNRYINLLTLYNTEMGTSLTATTCLHDNDFKRWVKQIIDTLAYYMRDITTKYNDGDAPTFTSLDEVHVSLLTYFDKAINNIPTMLEGNTSSYVSSTANYWQNSGTDMLPTLATLGTVTDATSSASVESVVGLIYTNDTCVLTDKEHKITSDYVHRGDFDNYADNIVTSAFYNTHNNAIVLRLA